MKKILFFSSNINKVKEIKNIFKKNKLNILSLNDFANLKNPLENGKTFVENAKIKSSYGFEKTKIPCFSDDSGICIEALKNGPGVHSKRYFNGFKNQKDCFKYILEQVNKSKNNNAFFFCSICFTLDKNKHIIFNGKVGGTISKMIRGERGFGYDPIFIPGGYSKTFAEIGMFEKNKISHRSIAINKLINFLIN